MKYPQLVSTIAIREITDWLVKRLEELDLENPLIYARLLLSLLDTPLKVNAIDIVEVSRNLYHINSLQCYCTHDFFFHTCMSAKKALSFATIRSFPPLFVLFAFTIISLARFEN